MKHWKSLLLACHIQGIRARACVCARARTHACARARMHAHMCVCMHVCTRLCLHACMRLCVYISVYATHTHTHTFYVKILYFLLLINKTNVSGFNWRLKWFDIFSMVKLLIYCPVLFINEKKMTFLHKKCLV